MMFVAFRMTTPEKANFTISITMSLGDWKKLREQLANVYPGWTLSSKIDEVVKQAEKVFWIDEDDED
jgi:hypothetical protein